MINRWWLNLRQSEFAQYRIADVEALRQRCNRQAAEIDRLALREQKLLDGLVPVYSTLSRLAQLQLDVPDDSSADG